MITPLQLQRDLVHVREAELARGARHAAQLTELRDSADHQSGRHHYLDHLRNASHALVAFAVRRLKNRLRPRRSALQVAPSAGAVVSDDLAEHGGARGEDVDVILRG
jgi:hypothetical protein